jgi:hypothetical protein
LYREDLSFVDLRNFISLAKQFNLWKANQIKDTIINKYVFPYILHSYDKNSIASISVKKQGENE